MTEFPTQTRPRRGDTPKACKPPQLTYRFDKGIFQEASSDLKSLLAYFNEANDAGLGIIHRPWFEARLKSYFEGPQSHGDDDDPGWYALRNTIYASGCRIELSKTQSLKESNEAAWGWFENALSAHTEILYFRTSMVGIQALTTMVGVSKRETGQSRG